MESKFKEKIESTVELKNMRDKFLAKRLLRTWSEDFCDEDTGDVVSIERNELILDKGVLLDNEALTRINFHLQSGDIKEVLVSNQCRSGTAKKRNASVWQVTVTYGLNKKYNVFMYSDSIDSTRHIANDYLEQLVQGLFSIVGIKELDYSTLIPLEFGEQDENIERVDFEADYYKLEVSIVDEDNERFETFIVNATDAENAKEIIIEFLAFKKLGRSKEAEDYVEIVTIISAKTIPCDYVIDYEFSLEYLQDDNES